MYFINYCLCALWYCCPCFLEEFIAIVVSILGGIFCPTVGDKRLGTEETANTLIIVCWQWWIDVYMLNAANILVIARV